MLSSGLNGVSENQKSKRYLILFLEAILPCTKKAAIAYLALKSGHTTRYIREELIDPLIDLGSLVFDGESISLPDNSRGIDIVTRDITPKPKALEKQENELEGEYPRDEKGNHYKDAPSLHVTSDGKITRTSEEEPYKGIFSNEVKRESYTAGEGND
jgi:hypothetical protein